MKIAVLGPNGTFSHKIAREIFTKDEIVVKDGLVEVFQEVKAKRADFGIVPVENSKEGLVLRIFDLMRITKLYVNGEAYLDIKQNLLGARGMPLSAIKKVYSHPQAIAQAREWLSVNLPHTAIIEVSSTALGAEHAKTQPDAVAIGSLSAAKEYGLSVLAKNIQGAGKNVTRFWIISPRQMFQPKTIEGIAFYKTTCYFSIQDKTGALCRLLEIFAKYEISLTSIVSRPLPMKVWEYGFFIDYKVRADDPLFKKALKEVKTQDLVKSAHLFGSYPLYGKFPEGVFAKQELKRLARIFSANAKILALSKIPAQTIFKNPFLIQALNVREMIVAFVAIAKFLKRAELFDKYREADIVSRLQAKAPKQYGAKLKRIYAQIFARSKRIQKDIIDSFAKNGPQVGVNLPLQHVRYYLDQIDDIIVYFL